MNENKVSKSSKVNIVMLVKDRQVLTTQTIRTLYKNTNESLFNLTIIDDGGSLLPSYEVGLASASNWTCLYNERSKGITGQARNLGVYWSEKYFGRGEYLCLLDNDLYFTKGWLETLIGAMNRIGQEWKILGGWNHPYLQPKEKYKFVEFVVGEKLPELVRHPAFVLADHDAVAGACQLMKWETWDKYGPLDAHAPGVGQSEDWKFCQDIIKDGGRVGSVYPRVVFNCGVTNTYGKASTGQKEMIEELVEAKKVYKDLYWE